MKGRFKPESRKRRTRSSPLDHLLRLPLERSPLLYNTIIHAPATTNTLYRGEGNFLLLNFPSLPSSALPTPSNPPASSMGRSKGKKTSQSKPPAVDQHVRASKKAKQGGFSYAEEFAKAINVSRTPDTDVLDGDAKWATWEDYRNAGDWTKCEQRSVAQLSVIDVSWPPTACSQVTKRKNEKWQG